MTLGPSVPFSLIICTWQKCAGKADRVMYIPPGRSWCLRVFPIFTCFDSSGSFDSFHSSVCRHRFSSISLLAFSSCVYPSSTKHDRRHQAPPPAITQAEIKTRKGMYLWRAVFPFLEQCRYLCIWQTSCIMWRNVHAYCIFQTCSRCAVHFLEAGLVFFTWTAIS